ncbi:Glycosyl transferases group 1 [Succinivibrio dextrinosolvens]|nr:Glycosyl transferases group 1 [Succinivibrio dextrinosolvens]
MNHIIMGGVEKVLCQYLLALCNKHQYDLTVVSKKEITDPYFIDFFGRQKIKLYDKIFCHRNKTHPFLLRLFHFILYKITWQHIINNNDIFIDFANCSFFYELKNIKKQKVAWCHGSINVYNQFLKRKLFNNTYNHIVFLSYSVINDIFLLEGISNPDKIICIYNPIDVSLVKKLASENSSIRAVKRYFVAVQRLDNYDKSVSTIIKAFDLFIKKNKDIELYIIGDGPDKKHLIDLAKNNTNIFFTGQLSNPYPIIKNALALVLSSTKKIGEGLPNVILEAQALETLVIASDVKSGVREILMDGEAGILFDAENEEALAEQLSYVVTNPLSCKQKIMNASKYLYRFDVEESVSKLEKIIDNKT